MTREELRKYMAAYRRKNRDRLNAQARDRRAEASPERRAKVAAEKQLWRSTNPDAARRIKQKYYASEKGKLQKKKEEAAYAASGGRAAAEKRRQGVSPARKLARQRYQLMRRASERTLDELSTFVLEEAIVLRDLRGVLTGSQWHVEHVIPVSLGGTSHFDNIQVVPALWNRRKLNHHTNAYWRK